MTVSRIHVSAAVAAGLVIAATAATGINVLAAGPANAQEYVSGYGSYWTGAYVGANAGLSTEDVRKLDQNGALNGGAQIGYRAEFGPAVIGAELQGNYANGQSYTVGGAGVLDQTWSGAAKLKAGVGLGSTLVYGTAGYGVANLESGAAGTDDAGWHGGVVFGGGIEQKLGGALSASLEYTQMRLGGVESQTGGISYSDDLVNHSIKAGLNFNF